MAKRSKTSSSEFVAKIHPGARPGEWQGHYEPAPSDPKARARAIAKAHKGLGKNAESAAARLRRLDPQQF